MIAEPEALVDGGEEKDQTLYFIRSKNRPIGQARSRRHPDIESGCRYFAAHPVRSFERVALTLTRRCRARVRITEQRGQSDKNKQI